MADPVPRLRVKLRDVVVGEMELHRNSVRFLADPSYVAADPRPVLGQIFEEDPERIRPSHHRLAPWFSNLLPEKGGPLREIIAHQLGVHPDREFFMLAGLGHDLPGAVTVAGPEGTDVPDLPAITSAAETPLEGLPLKFSLAGVQLKLSMLRDRRGLRAEARTTSKTSRRSSTYIRSRSTGTPTTSRLAASCSAWPASRPPANWSGAWLRSSSWVTATRTSRTGL